jgi:hypothetical protein
MALTQVSTDGVKNDAITKTKIPANQIEASELADNAVDTNAIADQAVALSKLPHGTSSNDGKFLRANNGADPSFETVSIPAGTTINNNADNRVITGSGTANTLNGEARLTFNGSLLTVSGYNDDNPVILDTDNGNGAHMRFQQQGSTKHYLGCGGGISMGNANQLSMRSTDHIHFGTGNSSTIRASFLNGGGLSFNGDTAAANALDDYEEGTWTPADGSGQSLSFTIYHANYLKVGKLVFISFYITFPSTSNTSGAQINNLPFTSANAYAHINGKANGQTYAIGQIEQSHTTMYFMDGTTFLSNANLSGDYVLLSGCYIAA